MSAASSKIVYDAIVRAAKAGEVCPSNAVLAGLIGAASVSSAAEAVTRLAKAGSIVVNRFQTGRDVTIPALGISTAPYGGTRSTHWRARDADTSALRERQKPAPRRVQAPSSRERIVRVSRDPCFWCGARADLGCRHHAPAFPVEEYA